MPKKEHWRALGTLFFLSHQRKLIWLLNAPILKLWFRWALRIHKDLSYRERVCGIRPNSYTVYLGRKDKEFRLRTDFRTHDKFSKRLYYAFRPLWWAVHLWDWMFAERWVPRWSFGFDTLTRYPDEDPETNTFDGHNYRWDGSSEWDFATLIGSSLTSVAGASTDSTEYAASIGAGPTSNLWAACQRSIFLFNTAALGSGATITAAVLSLFGQSKDNPLNLSIDIYISNPLSNTGYTQSDWNSFGSTSQTGAPIAVADFSVIAYNDFTFNATGRGNVSKTGISKFGARATNDAEATAPAWSANYSGYFGIYFAEQTGTANDPKLVVTYTAGAASAATSGTATANIVEGDVVAGGKTIIITLTGDTWIPS